MKIFVFDGCASKFERELDHVILIGVMQSLVVVRHVVHSHEHAFVVTRDEDFRRFFDEK